MKGVNSWSYRPYRPCLTEVGDIYICRLAPSRAAIHLEWLSVGELEYSVYYRLRDEGDFVCVCKTKENFCDISDLETERDYEFYVEAGDLRSRIRLARTGESVGCVVNYLHPDDEAYAFSGRYLCSPSLVRHPDGYLLASMDVYAGEHPQNLTLIYRSDDDGKSWRYVSELMPCFWGKMFIHKGELYMLACSTEYGDLLIGKSNDGGENFSAPVTLLRGSNGKKGNCGVHKNPQNMLCRGGRLWGTLEWGSWGNKVFCHAAMMMSCDIDADLLSPESWSFTEPRPFDNFAPELEGLPLNTMTIEGTPVEAPDGRLLNIMRFGKFGNVIAYEADEANPDAPLKYSHCIEFPANFSKFMIKYDERSGNYFSVATRVWDRERKRARNLLSLMCSPDLENWRVVRDIFDYRDCDDDKVGFQYVDFSIEGDDLIFLCRTALNGAHSYHDSNYSTFHRIENFRSLL